VTSAIAACAALVAVTASANAAAQPVERAPTTAEPPTKKHQYLADKDAARAANSGSAVVEARRRWHERLDKRLGKPPLAVVNLFNTWTHEYVVVDAEAKQPPPHAVVDWFLRCHFTNHPTTMDQRLFPLLMKAAAEFRSHRIDIISGYRADKYNLMLRKKGRGVARNSQHPQGNAVDFRVDGVSTQRLRAWAQRQRLGGVGYYPASKFVHVDTGPIRAWTDE
jgi:hypothetical protein